MTNHECSRCSRTARGHYWCAERAVMYTDPAHPPCMADATPSPSPTRRPAPTATVQLVIPQCELPVSASSDRCVVVVVSGERVEAEHAITGPAQRRYADRCGADFVVLRPTETQPRAVANKYVVGELAARYQQTLLLDADAVPMPDAPNVFDLVPVGSWGLALDRPETDAAGHRMQAGGFAALAAALGEPPANTDGRVWNSGVVVMPAHAGRIYRPPPVPVIDHWCVEQDYLTHRLLSAGEPVVTLGVEWNCGWHRQDFPQLLDSACVLHASGCQDHAARLPMLRDWVAGSRVAMPPSQGYAGFRPPWTRPYPAPLPVIDHAARLAVCRGCSSFDKPDAPSKCRRLVGCCKSARHPDPLDPVSPVCDLGKWPQ